MISFLRRFIDSKIGIVIMFLVLGLIALAFAAGDITGLGGMGTLASSGDTVAKVGRYKLTSAELTERIQSIYRQERQKNPQITLSELVAQGAIESVMNQLVGGLALTGFSRDQGVVISKRMIDGDIASIPAFQGPTGGFSEPAFRNALRQIGVTEKALRDDIERQKVAKQMLSVATLGTALPDSLVLPYASLLLEVRQGRLVAIPSAALVTTEAPDEKALAAYYARTARAYVIPEQRSLRYAVIDSGRFGKAALPTDAEIAAYYNGRKASYAARQTRNLEQLVVLTESTARNIAAAVAKGESLDDAAKKAGLATSKLVDQTPATLTAQTGADAARQVFAAAKDATIGPIKTPLGWTLVKVTAITDIAARSLDDARASIVTILSADKTHVLLSDLTTKVEDQAQDGATFDEIVKDYGLTAVTTPPLLKDGKSVSDPAFAGDADVKALLPAAFDADPSGDVVLAPVEPNKRYALVDVVNVVPAAAPPLAKVREPVVQAYKLEVAKSKARAAAEALTAKVNDGKDLAAAAAETGIRIPPIEAFGGRRADVMRSQNVPPPIAMLFAMAKGSTKVLELANNAGFVVIHLDNIQRSDAAGQPDLVATVRTELQKAVGFEHADQLEKAIEKEMKLKTYPETVARVKADLGRAGSGG